MGAVILVQEKTKKQNIELIESKKVESKKSTKNEEISKPRLLIATDNFLPRIDGISIFLSKIIPLLSKKFDITVVAPKFGKHSSENYKLIQIPIGKFGIGDYVGAKLSPKKINKLVHNSDIIFSQTIGPIGALAIHYGKKRGVPIASFMHSLEWELAPMATDNMWLRKFLYPFMKFLVRREYNKADLLMLPSEGIAERVSWQGINTPKHIVHLGVDCEVFKPYYELSDTNKKKVDKLREELGLSNCFVVGTHGRIAREKNLFTIYRAFKWLEKKNENTRLVFIGDGVKEIKDKLSSSKNILVLSAKEDIYQYLNLFDVYVTASLTETTSLSTLEGMASGLPVISTPVGFIKEYIQDNVNGLLFSPRDEFELYKKLDLLMNNKTLANAIGSRARKYVVSNFSWQETIQRISESLNTLLK